MTDASFTVLPNAERESSASGRKGGREGAARVTSHEEARVHPAVGDLAPITIDLRERVKQAAQESGALSWSHFFPYLYFFGSLDGSMRLRHEIVDDALLLYRFEKKKGVMALSLLVPPFPFSVAALRHARERMEAFAMARGASISRAPEREALLLAREGWKITFNADEYVYAPPAVEALEGGAFASVRRKLKQYPASRLTVREYRQEDMDESLALLRRWREELGDHGVTVGPYHRYARSCLKNFHLFSPEDLTGQVLEVDGVIGAFSFGGPITKTCGSIFITVADRRFPGLAYVQRQRFVTALSGMALVNDGFDSKRSGMAQMKRSFSPVRMHGVFVARA